MRNRGDPPPIFCSGNLAARGGPPLPISVQANASIIEHKRIQSARRNVLPLEPGVPPLWISDNRLCTRQKAMHRQELTSCDSLGVHHLRLLSPSAQLRGARLAERGIASTVNGFAAASQRGAFLGVWTDRLRSFNLPDFNRHLSNSRWRPGALETPRGGVPRGLTGTVAGRVEWFRQAPRSASRSQAKPALDSESTRLRQIPPLRRTYPRIP